MKEISTRLNKSGKKTCSYRSGGGGKEEVPFVGNNFFDQSKHVVRTAR